MLARMGLWVREISFSDAAAVAAVRPDHRAHLAELLERGRLRMSGPWASGEGAYIVYDAPDEAAARELVAADPYTAAGVVTEVALREWTVTTGG
jgi:uncharacterized protein YciI